MDETDINNLFNNISATLTMFMAQRADVLPKLCHDESLATGQWTYYK